MPRTVIALFDTIDEARHAVRDLLAAGINRDSISLIARDVDGRYASEIDADDDDDVQRAVASGATTGGLLGGVAGVLVGLNSLAIPGVGPIVAIGPIAGGFAGLGIGAAAGGLTGGLAEAGVDDDEADVYAEGVRRGGTLVAVHVEDDDDTEETRDILDRNHPVDIDERSARWREEGWDRHDPSGQPYTADEIERERTWNKQYGRR